ncbi:MAG: UDP-N-acetylmuramoylalanyl-D-glutamate--2,6-diaminopimelate ligase [Adlercreutzia equolifaciens]
MRAVKAKVTCPACGADDVDVRSYESLMALRSDLALFTLTCPHCAARISALLTIPPELREGSCICRYRAGRWYGRP